MAFEPGGKAEAFGCALGQVDRQRVSADAVLFDADADHAPLTKKVSGMAPSSLG